MALGSGELRPQIRFYDFGGQLRADDARAEAEHVRVVIFDALVRGKRVVACARADAAKFIGRDARAHTAAAEQNAALGAASENGLGDLLRVIGIIDRIGRTRAEIDRLMSQSARDFDNVLFQREPGVIRRHWRASTVSNGGNG